jgi:hypothetical protein
MFHPFAISTNGAAVGLISPTVYATTTTGMQKTCRAITNGGAAVGFTNPPGPNPYNWQHRVRFINLHPCSPLHNGKAAGDGICSTPLAATNGAIVKGYGSQMPPTQVLALSVKIDTPDENSRAVSTP